jgi:hypothetical protein
MSAITSGREVALTSGLINFTNSLPASMSTPALLYVAFVLLKSDSSSNKIKNLNQRPLKVKPKLVACRKTGIITGNREKTVYKKNLFAYDAEK